MAFTGFDFRQTATFVTDPAGMSYANNQIIYNPVANGGLGWGWTNNTAIFGTNKSNTLDPRIAGWQWWNAGYTVFRADLPNGLYDFRIGIQSGSFKMVDGNNYSTILNYANLAGANNQVWDATATARTWAAWPTDNALVRARVTQGYIQFQGPTSPFLVLQHFSYQPVSGQPLVDVQLTDDTGMFFRTNANTVNGSNNISFTPQFTFNGNINANGAANAVANTPAGIYGATIPTGIENAQQIFSANGIFAPNVYTSIAYAGSQGANTMALSYGWNGNGILGGTNTTFFTSKWRSGWCFYGDGLPQSGAVMTEQDFGDSSKLDVRAIANTTSGNVYVTAGRIYLYEKSPPGKLIGKIICSTGPQNFTIYEADGTTPNQYIRIRNILNDVWLEYSNTYFPGTSDSYTFKIAQTDSSGIYSGSPHVTTITLPVILAPDKPTDGSILAKISTPAYLLRKKVVDFINANKWPGYRNQTFANTATVYSLTDLFNTMSTFSNQALAANNGGWYKIMIGTNGLEDWNTAYSNGPYINFLPEKGGGCLVQYAPGTAPYIYGSIYTSNMRGVHWDGIQFLQTFRMQDINTGPPFNKTISVLHFTNCGFGWYANPANDPANYETDWNNNRFNVALYISGDMHQQLTVSNSVFKGCSDCFLSPNVWLFEVDHCDVQLCNDDFIRSGQLSPTSPGVQFLPNTANVQADGRCDNYLWIHDNVIRNCQDFPETWINSGQEAYFPHADHNQQQTQTFPNCPIQYRVMENELETMQTHKAFQLRNQSNGHVGWIGRQFVIQSDIGPQYNVYINNVIGVTDLRGLETGCGVNYCEYNTFLGAASMPPSSANTKITSISTYVARTNPMRGSHCIAKLRKNISPVANGVYRDLNYPVIYLEDNVKAGFEGTKGTGFDPSLYMSGNFYADPIETVQLTGRVVYDLPTDNGSQLIADYRRYVFDIARPKVDAGAQCTTVRILANTTHVIQGDDASTMSISTYKHVPAVVNGAITISVANTANNTNTSVTANIASVVNTPTLNVSSTGNTNLGLTFANNLANVHILVSNTSPFGVEFYY